MKKGSFYSILMFFAMLGLILSTLLILNTLEIKDALGNERHIGNYQKAQLDALQEAENRLLYLDQAAKYSTRSALLQFDDRGRQRRIGIDGGDAPEFVQPTACGEFVYTKWSTLNNFCPPETPQQVYEGFFRLNLALFLSKGPYDIPAGNYEYNFLEEEGEYYIEGIASEPIVVPILAEPVFNEFNGDFIWPVEGPVITSCFGERDFSDNWHDGLDFRNTGSGEVRAIAAGRVISVCNEQTCSTIRQEERDGETVTVRNPDCPKRCRGLGNYVIISHDGTVYSAYNHMAPDSIRVEKWQEIQKGQAIGRVGNTGASLGEHLDMKIYTSQDFRSENGKNPMCFYDEGTLYELETAENANNCVSRFGENPTSYRKELFETDCDEINYEKLNNKLDEDYIYDKKKIGEYEVLPNFKVKTPFVLPGFDNDIQTVVNWAEDTWESCEELPEVCLTDNINEFNAANNEYSLTTDSCEEYWFYNRIIEAFERCLEIDAFDHICKVGLTSVPFNRHSRLGDQVVRLEGYEIIQELPVEKRYFLGNRLGYYSERASDPDTPEVIELRYQNGRVFMKVGDGDYESYPELKLYKPTMDKVIVVKAEVKENGDGVPTLNTNSNTFLVCAESRTLYDFEIDGELVSKPRTIKFAMELKDNPPDVISSSDVETETIEEDKESLKEKALSTVLKGIGIIIGIPPQVIDMIIATVGETMRAAVQVCIDLPPDVDVSGFEVYCGVGTAVASTDLDGDAKFLSVENPYIRSRIGGKYDIQTKIDSLELARAACIDLSIDMAGQQTVNQNNNDLAESLSSQVLTLNELGLTTAQTNEFFLKAYNGDYGVCPENTLKNFLPDEPTLERTSTTTVTTNCEGLEVCEIETEVNINPEITIFDVEPLQRDVESDTNNLPSDRPDCDYATIRDSDGRVKFVKQITGTQDDEKICFNIGACGGNLIEQLATGATSYCVTLVPVDSNGNKGRPVTKCQSMKSVTDRVMGLIGGGLLDDGYIKIVTDASEALDAIRSGDYSDLIDLAGDTDIFGEITDSEFVNRIRNNRVTSALENAYNYLERQNITDNLWNVARTARDKADLLDGLLDADNIPPEWKQKARETFADNIPIEDAKEFMGQIAEDMENFGQDAKNKITGFVSEEAASLGLLAKLNALKTVRGQCLDLTLAIEGQYQVNLNYNSMAEWDNLPLRQLNELGLTDFQTNEIFSNTIKGQYGECSREALMKSIMDKLPAESVERLYKDIVNNIPDLNLQGLIDGQIKNAAERTKAFVSEEIINRMPDNMMSSVTGLLNITGQQELLRNLFEEHGDELRSVLDGLMGGIFGDLECSDNPYDYLGPYLVRAEGVFNFFGLDDLGILEKEKFLRENLGSVYGMVSNEEFGESVVGQVESMAEEQKTEMFDAIMLEAGVDPNIRIHAREQLSEVASLSDKQNLAYSMNSQFDELSGSTQNIVMANVESTVPGYSQVEKVAILENVGVQNKVEELGAGSVSDLTQGQTDQLMSEVLRGDHGAEAQRNLLDSFVATNPDMVNDIYGDVALIDNDQVLDSIYQDHVDRLSDDVKARTTSRIYEQLDFSQGQLQLVDMLPTNAQERILGDLISNNQGAWNSIQNAISFLD